ncbi:putative chitinase II [Klebsiella variicola]|nr:putative chitinase II [Klebsiella variicola]
MKRLPLLAALPLLCASALSAQPLMSVGYFNGGGDVTAGPGGDIDKLDVRQITHLNYSFGLIYNDEKDETNAALKDPAHLHEIWLSPKVQADLQKLPALRKQNPDLKVLLSVGGWGRAVSPARRQAKKPVRCLFSLRRKLLKNMVWMGLTSTGSFRSTAPGGWLPANRPIAITLPRC